MAFTFSTNKQNLLTHFRKDPVLFAYHIGDLDDFFFSLCQWPVLENENGDVEEAILIYNNPAFPTVMLFGLTDRFGELLIESIPRLPNKFFCHFQQASLPVFLKYFEIESLGTHLKMELKDFISADGDDSKNIRRLKDSDLGIIKEFYKSAYPDVYFDPRMLETGKCFGYFEDQILASVATVHVYSPEYDIAVLGSIATHPEFRNRGLAGMVTSRLTRELAKEVSTIALNVKADNYPAIRCYEKLGFVVKHEYEEAHLLKKH